MQTHTHVCCVCRLRDRTHSLWAFLLGEQHNYRNPAYSPAHALAHPVLEPSTLPYHFKYVSSFFSPLLYPLLLTECF